jgi:hypothetical protein
MTDTRRHRFGLLKARVDQIARIEAESGAFLDLASGERSLQDIESELEHIQTTAVLAEIVYRLPASLAAYGCRRDLEKPAPIGWDAHPHRRFAT